MEKFSNKLSLIFPYILFISFLGLFVKCSKDEHNTEFINQETKDFIVFKPGSWWVYRKNITNEIDTWKLISRSENIIPADETNNYNTEKITMTIYTNLNDSFQYSIENFGADFKTGKYFGLFQAAYFENGKDKIGSCDNNYIRIIKRDSLNGQCIRREFDLYPVPCTTHFPVYTKWERNLGLTKMAYFNGDTFTLIEQNILQ